MLAAQKPETQDVSENGGAPQDETLRPNPTKEIEAAKGEVVENGPNTKTLIWHGVALVLPAELGAAMMFDVFEAQLGDETSLLRAIYQAVGKEQWAKARAVAVEEHLPADEFHKLVNAVLAEYGMAPGEQSDSADSSENGGGS